MVVGLGWRRRSVSCPECKCKALLNLNFPKRIRSQSFSMHNSIHLRQTKEPQPRRRAPSHQKRTLPTLDDNNNVLHFGSFGSNTHTALGLNEEPSTVEHLSQRCLVVLRTFYSLRIGTDSFDFAVGACVPGGIMCYIFPGWQVSCSVVSLKRI